jgi:hypothetical protein
MFDGRTKSSVLCVLYPGYVIYSVKLKQAFVGLPGSEIKQLRLSGVDGLLLCPAHSSKVTCLMWAFMSCPLTIEFVMCKSRCT